MGSVTGFLFFGESGVVAVNDPSSTPPAPPRPKPTVGIEAAGISRAEPPPPAQGEKKLSVRFEINAQASLGSREMRVVTPQGVSNPIEVKISQFKEQGFNKKLLNDILCLHHFLDDSVE